MAPSIDLAKLFSVAMKELVKNQNSLNEADSYNHDHGDHMVEIFDVISQAMKEKKSASAADQLEYASQLLRQKTRSGSGKAYASGLERAATAFLGQDLTKENAGKLIQSLLGAEQVNAPAAAAQGEDVLGSLISNLAGGGQQPDSEQQGSQGLDAGDLLNAGLSYLLAKKAGKGDLDALLGAVVNSSAIGQEAHRAESGTLIANALLTALSKVK